MQDDHHKKEVAKKYAWPGSGRAFYTFGARSKVPGPSRTTYTFRAGTSGGHKMFGAAPSPGIEAGQPYIGVAEGSRRR